MTEEVAEPVKAGSAEEPDAPRAPPFSDRVRAGIARTLLWAVSLTFGGLVTCTVADWITVDEARELGLLGVALYGIAGPVLAFYFANGDR